MIAATRQPSPVRPRVLLVQPLYAHYRFATLLALSESQQIDFDFAAGTDTFQGNVATFDKALLPSASSLRNIWLGPFLWQRGLVSALFSRKYSAVVLTGSDTHFSAWVAAVVARLRGTRVLFWTTGWHRKDPAARGALRVAFYRLAHQLLLYNQRGFDLGAQSGYPRSQMTVIFNSQGSPPSGVTGERGSDSALFLKGSTKPTVIAVVRLIATKKLDQLIRAAAILSESGNEIRLVLAGDGPELERLRLLAHELSVELILPGGIYDEDTLRELYAIATVTVVPGPVGLTAVQSMKYGVPVISHSNPDHQVAEWESIREAQTGGLFVEDDVEDLARVISSWTSSPPQRLRDARADCLEEYSAKWTPEGHADRIVEGIMSTLSTSKRSDRRTS